MSEEQTDSAAAVDPDDPGRGTPDPGAGTTQPRPYEPPRGSDG